MAAQVTRSMARWQAGTPFATVPADAEADAAHTTGRRASLCSTAWPAAAGGLSAGDANRRAIYRLEQAWRITFESTAPLN